MLMFQTASKLVIAIRTIIFSFALAAACASPEAARRCELQNGAQRSPLTFQQLQNIGERFTRDPDNEDTRREVLAVLQSIDASDRAFAVSTLGRTRRRNVD